MSVDVTVFDGANSIGGTKIHLLTADVGVFLDFGMNFKKYGLYFEEFLRPRPTRGIYDLLALELIPAFRGLYREDLFPPDLKMEVGIKPKVDAIFLSHAHLDHCGNAGLFDRNIPVYSSAMTATTIKAMQDIGTMSFESEVAYISPRMPTTGDPLALGTHREASCLSRQIFLVDRPNISPSDAFEDFFKRTYSKKELDWILPTPAEERIGSIEFKAFPVDHSIAGATSYAFETPSGWVAYTGDFRLHGSRKNLSRRMVEDLARLKPRLLIVEGTNLEEAHAGEGKKRTTEEEVFSNCLEEVKDAKGKLVIADFGPRNIERLLTFLEIAKETKRCLVILPKDAYLLQAMRLVDRGIPDLLAEAHLSIFEETKASLRFWEKNFIKRKYYSEYIRAEEIHKNQGEFILAFSFWDLKHLLDIKPSGGIYIYSSSEAFSEEQEFDLWRLSNWLDFLGIEPVGFRLEKPISKQKTVKLNFAPGYHCSGHISGNELIEIIKEVQPRTLVPVHTESPYLFVEKLKGEVEVILPEEGRPISI